MGTISTAITQEVTLAVSGTYSSPLTITSSGAVEAGATALRWHQARRQEQFANRPRSRPAAPPTLPMIGSPAYRPGSIRR